VPKKTPVGSVALILQIVIAPPATDGLIDGDIVSFTVKTKLSGEYDMEGIWSLIVMLTVVEDEPPLLLAHTVYVTGEIRIIVGVPQMVPLLAPKFNPGGRLVG